MSEREPSRHRITVDDYLRMWEVGLIPHDARVELIEGEIIDMPPMGNPHVAVVTLLRVMLSGAVRDRAIVREQAPLLLDNESMPQPDLKLVKPRHDYYFHKTVDVGDTLLAIEVSDTTLRYDLKRKGPLYARCGVREFWVIDVHRCMVHIHRSLKGSEYTDVSERAIEGSIDIEMLPGICLDLSRLKQIF